jgi:opacity protein-like surface antigen
MVTLIKAKNFPPDDSVTSSSNLRLAWLELRKLGKPIWLSCHRNGVSLTFSFLSAMAAVLSLTAVASAADMRASTKAPPRSQTCNVNWFQGWYVGLNFGAGGYMAYRTDQDGQLINAVNGQLINVSTYTQRQSGIFGGGGQFGYNWTTCNGLFGFEVDGSHGSIVVSTAVLPNSPNADVSITSRFNDLVTARVRTGVVVDNVLLYVTGGVAAVHTLTTYLNFVGDQFTFSDWRAGWVAGVGAELAITSNISARSEVLYVGAGDRTFTFVSPTLGPGNFAHSDSMWLARLGLNVKLGFDPAIPTY